MTERDIFYEPDTSFSTTQIYTKYRNISLTTWDPIQENAFYDYVNHTYLSLSQLNDIFNDYTPMALQKLGYQLKTALNRWQNDIRAEPFRMLYNRINEVINQILYTDVIDI